MSIRSVSAGAAALVCLATASAVAQGGGNQGHASDLGVAVRAGTLGIGGEVSKLLASHLGLRVGINYFTVTDNGQSLGDNKFDLKAELRAFSALLDLYPGPRGSFHITGGVMTKPVKISGPGVGNTTYSFNSNHYTSAQTGAVTIAAEYGSVLPYVGIGFGTAASKQGGLSFVFDLGLAIGKPVFTLTAASAIAGSALANDLKAEEVKRQDDVSKVPGYPVLAIGFMYRF